MSANISIEPRTSVHGFVYQGSTRRMLYKMESDGNVTLSGTRGWRDLTPAGLALAKDHFSHAAKQEP